MGILSIFFEPEDLSIFFFSLVFFHQATAEREVSFDGFRHQQQHGAAASLLTREATRRGGQAQSAGRTMKRHVFCRREIDYDSATSDYIRNVPIVRDGSILMPSFVNRDGTIRLILFLRKYYL